MKMMQPHHASASHLLLYQLLALYGGLAPALRHAAVRVVSY